MMTVLFRVNDSTLQGKTQTVLFRVNHHSRKRVNSSLEVVGGGHLALHRHMLGLQFFDHLVHLVQFRRLPLHCQGTGRVRWGTSEPSSPGWSEMNTA